MLSHSCVRFYDRIGGVPMKLSAAFLLCFAASGLSNVPPLLAEPIDPAEHSHAQQARDVHKAEHTVDHAWEVYHGAALGGTVASPNLQAHIEQHLHEARTLVTKAHEAAERGDKSEVDRLVVQIRVHASRAIEGSKERKK